MNWRKENQQYQQSYEQHLERARGKLEGIKTLRDQNAAWLIWAVGPSMLVLPNSLPKYFDLKYSITRWPTNEVLNSEDSVQELAATSEDIRENIDRDTKYYPSCNVTVSWFGPDYNHHVLRLGIIPFVEYSRTDTSDGYDVGDGRYIYHNYKPTYRLALISPNYNDTTPSHELEKRGCTIITRNINRLETKPMLVFPTKLNNYSNGQYRTVQAAIDKAIHEVLPKTTVKNFSWDVELARLNDHRTLLKKLTYVAHSSPSPESQIRLIQQIP